jgi:hypothetical protein
VQATDNNPLKGISARPKSSQEGSAFIQPALNILSTNLTQPMSAHVLSSIPGSQQK